MEKICQKWIQLSSTNLLTETQEIHQHRFM